MVKQRGTPTGTGQAAAGKKWALPGGHGWPGSGRPERGKKRIPQSGHRFPPLGMISSSPAGKWIHMGEEKGRNHIVNMATLFKSLRVEYQIKCGYAYTGLCLVSTIFSFTLGEFQYFL